MLTIDDVVTEFGAYYLANRANAQNLKNKLFAPTQIEEHFRQLTLSGTQYETAYGIMSRITQPWKKDWSPIDALELKPKVIQLKKLKIDLEENPDQFEESWLGFLGRMESAMAAQGKNLDRSTWPFIRWYLEEWIIPKHKEDLELNEDYFGVAATPASGPTAGAAGTIYDGIGKQIDDAQGLGIMPTVNTSTLETANDDFVSQIEEWVRTVYAAHPHVAGRKLKLFMAAHNALKYKAGFRALYQNATDFTGNNPIVIDTNVEVIGLNAMTNDPANPGTPSNKIFMTLPENCILPIKLGENKNYFKVESLKRDVFIYTDYFRAIGFEQDQYVFANELS